jgi:glutamyl-tRNA synthetase
MDMTECSCRNKDHNTVKKEWENMKAGKYEEGELALRLKIDMTHKNAVMRDPVIFRLSYTPHYRQGTKYKVWPMYDFENSIEEGLLRVTHVLRSNEFETRIELQNYIRDLFGLPNPTIRQYARFNITGAVTQGRDIRNLIESGEYIGWDDPRLVTLRALKRRGIVKEAYYELAKIIGMSKAVSNLDFSVIESVNRKLLDESALRFFFIDNPVEIEIEKCPEQEIEMHVHPDKKIQEKTKGKRLFRTKSKFYVSKKDFEHMKNNELIRLMDCMNFKKENGKFIFDSIEYESYKDRGKQIIHWLPKDETIEIEIVMPDNTKIRGLAEKNISMLKVDDVIQFERFGFCRLDKKENGNYIFWYTHK